MESFLVPAPPEKVKERIAFVTGLRRRVEQALLARLQQVVQNTQKV